MFNFLAFLLTVAIIILVILGLIYFINIPTNDYEKHSAYECGFEPFGDARSFFDIHFYTIGLLFIIFDLEIVFLIPFAIDIEATLAFEYFNFVLFMAILLVGFYYEWAIGLLNWVPTKLFRTNSTPVRSHNFNSDRLSSKSLTCISYTGFANNKVPNCQFSTNSKNLKPVDAPTKNAGVTKDLKSIDTLTQKEVVNKKIKTTYKQLNKITFMLTPWEMIDPELYDKQAELRWISAAVVFITLFWYGMKNPEGKQELLSHVPIEFQKVVIYTADILQASNDIVNAFAGL